MEYGSCDYETTMLFINLIVALVCMGIGMLYGIWTKRRLGLILTYGLGGLLWGVGGLLLLGIHEALIRGEKP